MYTLAIIGGGAAGVSTFYQLVERFLKTSQFEKPKIVLIEKASVIGPGLVYSTTANEAFLLNISAMKMSPIPDQPNHFIEWLKDSSNLSKWKPLFPKLDIEASEYLPRKLFGIYLADLAMKTKVRAQKNGITVEFICAEATNVVSEEEGLKIEMNTGESFLANSVMLCIGHLPPSQDEYQQFNSIPTYYNTPWNIDFSKIPIEENLLILGTRLTAIDAILARSEYIKQQTKIDWEGNIGKIIAVSHTGLLPKVIGDTSPSYVRKELTLETIHSATAYGTQTISLTLLKRMFKAELKRAYGLLQGKEIELKLSQSMRKSLDFEPQALLEKEIEDAKQHIQRPWQTVLFSLYPIVPRLWEALEDEGKKKFLTKYYTFWLTYLAAFPIENAEKILSLLKSGHLELYPGLEEVTYSDESHLFNIKIKDNRSFQGKFLINATGQGHDITKTNSLLLKNLLANGYIVPHALGGIEVKFKSLRAVSRTKDIPLFVVGDTTWGACMATADLSQIVNNQIPRAINSMLRPLKKHQLTSLVVNRNTVFAPSFMKEKEISDETRVESASTPPSISQSGFARGSNL